MSDKKQNEWIINFTDDFIYTDTKYFIHTTNSKLEGKKTNDKMTDRLEINLFGS